MAARVLLLFLSLTPQHPDTATFRDATTAAVITRARARHARQDSLLHDYQAWVDTRLEAVASRSRFSRAVPLLAHETVARLTWRAPNDLTVDVAGARSALPMLRLLEAMGVEVNREDVNDDLRRELQSEAWLDRPWFVPRALGDSVRVMGIPDLAALHPLAPGAEGSYRYAVTDSVVLVTPGRTVRALAVRVEPKRNGPSLVAGDMWLDADQGDLVRLRVLFLGEYLWESPDTTTPQDSAKARRDNRTAARYLSAEADVEYALHEGRFWMPYRQGVVVTFRVPWLLNLTIPLRAVTRFHDYVVNTGVVLRFAIPDSALSERRGRVSVRLCAGCAPGDSVGRRATRESGYRRAGRWGDGRWEVTVPPADSLARHSWPEPLVIGLEPTEERWLQETGVELAKLGQQLPDGWVGRRRFGVAWERVSDAFRFNRVQGPSVGLGWVLNPRDPFLRLVGTARFGFSDQRPTGSLRWGYEGPEARVELVGYRMMRAVEPWSEGGFAGSINAVFAAHDDADYYLATGGGIEVEPNLGLLAHTTIGVLVQRERSVATVAASRVNDALGGDGRFPANPPVVEGEYLRLAVSRADALGPVGLRAGGEVAFAPGLAAARFWARGRTFFRLAGRGTTLSGSVGAVAGEALPQLLLRVGGPATVRGHQYGVRSGRTAWAAQLDWNLRTRGLVMPVIFLDAGDRVPTRDPLVGAGLGVALIGGLLRFDLSKGLNPEGPLRFDITTRLPR